MKGDGAAFFSSLARALLPFGVELFFLIWCGESGSAPEAGGNLSLAFQTGFVVCPVVATARAPLFHHDGLLEHHPVYRLEGLWF